MPQPMPSPDPDRPGPGRRASRRAFLATVGRLGAATAVGLHGGSLLARQGEDAETHAAALRVLDEHFAIDLHAHPGLFASHGLPGALGEEALGETVVGMVEGRLSAAFFATVSDLLILERQPQGIAVARSFRPDEAWRDYERQVAALDSLLAPLPVQRATAIRDLDGLGDRGQVAAFLACEGGDCLEGRVDRLAHLYADGVRLLQLVHYAPNELGDLQTQEPRHGGLSGFGREVVREMNRLGMIVDVAHASFDTVAQVVETSSQPVVLSHSQLRHGDRTHPRLLTTEHARLVADAGGLIGMWPSGFGNDSLADFVENTLRLVELVGVEHVGLGTDMDGNYRPVFHDYRQLPTYVAGLLDEGLSEPEAAALVGGNALRLLQRIVG
jgi:membrane dipeptidase